MQKTCDASLGIASCSSSSGAKEPGMLATFHEEMPPAYAQEKFSTYFRLTWFFAYGEGFYGPRVLDTDNVGASDPMTANRSTFLHPKLHFFQPGGEDDSLILQHWIMEDLNFRFQRNWTHKGPLR